MNRALGPKDIPLDPLVYLARVIERDENGRARRLEVIYDDEVVEVEDGMELVTITTQVLLEEP